MKGKHQADREYKRMYTVRRKLRNQLLTIHVVMLSMYNIKGQN